MFLISFVATALVSLASFFAILTFASPQANPMITGLFFLTLFTSVSSVAALGHFFIFHLKGISLHEHQEYRSIIFRRGIFLGGFATLLFIFEAIRKLTPLMGIALLVFFVGVEIFMTHKDKTTSA